MTSARTTFTWLRVELAPAETAASRGDEIGSALSNLGYHELARTRIERGDRRLVLYGLNDAANLPFAIERRRDASRDRVGLLIPQLRF